VVIVVAQDYLKKIPVNAAKNHSPSIFLSLNLASHYLTEASSCFSFKPTLSVPSNRLQTLPFQKDL
jgi:hypothetical protein